MLASKDVVVEIVEAHSAGAEEPIASDASGKPDGPRDCPKRMRKKPQKETPLPMRQLVPMTFVLLNETILQTMLVPIAGLLVSQLQGISKEEAGKYTGALTGSFMFGQLCSGKLWGTLSDKYGRRFPLISGLFTSGVLMLGFGLAPNVWVLALFRVCMGLCGGTVLVAKTIISDICDETNSSKGFAFVAFCFGIGGLIGPIIGSQLFDPTAPDSSMGFLRLDPDGIFGKRPALLPSIFIFLYSIVGMTACTFFVQESNLHAKPLPSLVRMLYPCMWVPWKQFEKPAPPGEEVTIVDATDDGGDAHAGKEVGPHTPVKGTAAQGSVHEDTSSSGGDADVPASSAAREYIEEDQRVAEEVVLSVGDDNATHADDGKERPVQFRVTTDSSTRNDNDEEDEDDSLRNAREAATSTHEGGAPTPFTQDMSGVIGLFPPPDLPPGHQAIRSQRGRGGYYVMTFHNFGYKQAFQYPPTHFLLILVMLLCAGGSCFEQSFPLWLIADRSVGGMGYGSKEIGYIMFIHAFPMISANLVFHHVAKRYDDKLRLYRHALAITATFMTLAPLASYFPAGWSSAAFLVMTSLVRNFFVAWCYAISTMLTATAAPKGLVGSVMGISQSVSCLVRGFVPLINDRTFAWSITGNHPPPFNHLLCFWFGTSILFYGCAWTCFRYSDEAGNVRIRTDGHPWVRFTHMIRAKLCGLCGRS